MIGLRWVKSIRIPMYVLCDVHQQVQEEERFEMIGKGRGLKSTVSSREQPGRKVVSSSPNSEVAYCFAPLYTFKL